MKRLLFLPLLVLTVLSASAQKTITVETSADEIVRLWDNTTAKHSNEMTKDEARRPRQPQGARSHQR